MQGDPTTEFDDRGAATAGRKTCERVETGVSIPNESNVCERSKGAGERSTRRGGADGTVGHGALVESISSMASRNSEALSVSVRRGRR